MLIWIKQLRLQGKALGKCCSSFREGIPDLDVPLNNAGYNLFIQFKKYLYSGIVSFISNHLLIHFLNLSFF